MSEKKVKRYTLVRHKWPDEIKQERNKKIRVVVTIAACILCFTAGFFVNTMTTANQVVSDPKFEKLSNIYDIMKHKYYFGKDKKNFSQTLINGAIEGMVNVGGDIHTSYMEPSASKSFTNAMSGSYVGIGIQFSALDENTFMINEVFKNSPAEEAKLMPGDLIYAVDGVICENMESDDVKNLIMDAPGSKVNLEIVRGNEHITKKLVRREVLKTVTSKAQGDVGLIQLETFADTSGEEFGDHLKDLSKTCKSIVIDLRGNSGGFLVAAQQIASYFLPEDTVVLKQKNRDGSENIFTSLKDTKHYTFDNVVLLVDENTASAAEVLAISLKENINATLVGQKTYGKGTIQVPLSFKDGSLLKYTSAKWLSPKGVSINEKGITPDVNVELHPVVMMPVPKLDKDQVYKADTVNEAAECVQTYLQFLGYAVDRTDSYFSPTSSNALKDFQKEYGLAVTGDINAEVVNALLSNSSTKWHSDVANDLQLTKAMEIANGN